MSFSIKSPLLSPASLGSLLTPTTAIHQDPAASCSAIPSHVAQGCIAALSAPISICSRTLQTQDEAASLRAKAFARSVQQAGAIDPGLIEFLNVLIPLDDVVRDLERGLQVPGIFLHNTGAHFAGIAAFVAGYPLRRDFPFAIEFPGCDLTSGIRVYGIQRDITNVTFEIDLNLQQLLEWVVHSPGWICDFGETHANYVSFSSRSLASFRAFLCERGVPMRVLVPFESDWAQTYYFSNHANETVRVDADDIFRADAIEIVWSGETSRRCQDQEKLAQHRAELLANARAKYFPEYQRLGALLATYPELLAHKQAVPMEEFLVAHGFGESFMHYLMRRYGFFW